MTDRTKLEALVWRRVPADLKVTASGARFVCVGGKLTPMTALSDADLFGVLRRVNVTKTVTKAMEAA